VSASNQIDRTSNKKVLPVLLSGSPDRNIDRTFTSIFYFPHKLTESIKNKPVYKNPLYLAKEYKKMIDSRIVKNHAELAKMKGISRARVTQILNLLKLKPQIIKELEKLGDPLRSRIVTERLLRSYIDKA